ncbi:aminotransferase class I/II-fold pyridoxal phosphate-dependent enzyme [Ekhidna sp.]
MIYLSPPNVGKKELSEISHVIDSGWVSSVGSAIDEFEDLLADYYGDRSVLALNSGTSALHLALILSGVEEGDHVLVSSFTFAACANVILYERAVPIFIDSEEYTWNLDPEVLEDYLKNAKRLPKALIVTHLFGTPAEIEKVCRIAKKYCVRVIEDAAEALGAKVRDRQVGGFGDFGVLSFNGNKIITTSAGGALVCSEKDKEQGRYLASQANSGNHGYDHKVKGFNYRMSNVLAGIGLGQLNKLSFFIKKKRVIYDRYKEELSGFIEFGPESDDYSNRWLTTGLVKRVEVKGLIEALYEQDIESREVWKPLHLHEAYNAFKFYGTGKCEQIFQKGICLPSGTGLTESEQAYVIEKVREYCNQ